MSQQFLFLYQSKYLSKCPLNPLSSLTIFLQFFEVTHLPFYFLFAVTIQIIQAKNNIFALLSMPNYDNSTILVQI